jgi:hypothetical protein
MSQHIKRREPAVGEDLVGNDLKEKRRHQREELQKKRRHQNLSQQAAIFVHRLQKPGDVKRRATSANDARRAIKTTRPVQSYSNSARLMMWGRFSDGFWTSASSAVTLPTMKKLLSFSSTIAGSGSFINPGHDVVAALAFSFKSFARRSISAQNF